MNVVAEIKPYLFLGSAAARTNDFLQKTNITLVVNAANRAETDKCKVKQIKVKCQDDELCDIKSHFEYVSAKIFEERENGGRVFVHCVGGISRSTTLILAYLMRYENMSLLQAYELVLSQRTFIRPNIGFWKQLVAYEFEIRGSNSVTIMTVQGGKENVVELNYRKKICLDLDEHS